MIYILAFWVLLVVMIVGAVRFLGHHDDDQDFYI